MLNVYASGATGYASAGRFTAGNHTGKASGTRKIIGIGIETELSWTHALCAIRPYTAVGAAVRPNPGPKEQLKGNRGRV